MCEWSESQARSMYLPTRSNPRRRAELALRIGDVIPVNIRRTPRLTLPATCATGSPARASFADRRFKMLPHSPSIKTGEVGIAALLTALLADIRAATPVCTQHPIHRTWFQSGVVRLVCRVVRGLGGWVDAWTDGPLVG